MTTRASQQYTILNIIILLYYYIILVIHFKIISCLYVILYLAADALLHELHTGDFNNLNIKAAVSSFEPDSEHK